MDQFCSTGGYGYWGGGGWGGGGGGGDEQGDRGGLGTSAAQTSTQFGRDAKSGKEATQSGRASQVDCNTKLPSGETLGDLIEKGRAQLQSIVDSQKDLVAAGGDVSPFRVPGAFWSWVKPNGPIDFKNMFAGQANAAFLGQAGNFAYYALGSGFLPDSVLDAGAGAYGVLTAVFGAKRFSSLTGRMFSDASAASVRDSALATSGCQK